MLNLKSEMLNSLSRMNKWEQPETLKKLYKELDNIDQLNDTEASELLDKLYRNSDFKKILTHYQIKTVSKSWFHNNIPKAKPKLIALKSQLEVYGNKPLEPSQTQAVKYFHRIAGVKQADYTKYLRCSSREISDKVKEITNKIPVKRVVTGDRKIITDASRFDYIITVIREMNDFKNQLMPQFDYREPTVIWTSNYEHYIGGDFVLSIKMYDISATSHDEAIYTFRGLIPKGVNHEQLRGLLAQLID